MPQFLLLVLGTFITEDFTSIAAGLLIAQHKLSPGTGVLACLTGIYVGDMLLFLAGRFAGRPALAWKPLRGRVTSGQIDRASAWLKTRGLAVIFASRFTPGLRLPVYFASGLLKTGFWRFSLYFLLAAAVWTPLLVGTAALFGEQVARGARVPAAILATVLLGLFARQLSFEHKRRFVGFVKRKLQWEFWPVWAAYLPLVPYLLYLAVKHRSATLFTLANPGIPSGGLVGESKAQILSELSASGAVARYALLPGAVGEYAKVNRALDFLRENELSFPVVLKPDVGERGSGVQIVRTEQQLRDYLRAAGDTIIQEYVPGIEFGVFYYRRPDEERGRIFSITEKRFPVVVGDGTSTIARLILSDPRAVCMAQIYISRLSRDPKSVPAIGESVPLAELGSHCRGAIFLDGRRSNTAELEAAVDRISKTHAGFFLGRYDVRAESLEAFQAGRFRIIELNGVSAEPTHIYDPSVSLLAAYSTMRTQWRLAFEIGAENRRRGWKPMGAVEILQFVCSSNPDCGFKTLPVPSKLPRPS